MKNKVIRVTDEEKELILYLRSNQQEIQKEINSILNISSLNFKHLSNINNVLNKNTQIEKLINEDFITKKIFDDILKNIDLNNVVLITGDKKTGKTTLLEVICENVNVEYNKIEIEDLSSFFMFLTYLKSKDVKPTIATIKGENWKKGIKELLINNNLNPTFIDEIIHSINNCNELVNYHTYIVNETRMVYKK